MWIPTLKYFHTNENLVSPILPDSTFKRSVLLVVSFKDWLRSQESYDLTEDIPATQKVRTLLDSGCTEPKKRSLLQILSPECSLNYNSIMF